MVHRRTIPVSTFVWSILPSIIFQGLFLDSIFYFIRVQGEGSYGTPTGGSIYNNPTLSPIHQFIASRLFCIPIGFAGYGTINIVYNIISLFSVLLLRQTPEQWPPLFNAPWKSTSLTEFWGSRWHQINRIIYLKLGGEPLGYLFGRPGTVMGAFLISAILHDWGMWGLGNGTDFYGAGGFFLLMGVGVVLEGLWRKLTGSRVGGVLGWIWTASWVVGWSGILVESWATHGLLGTVVPKSYYLTHHVLAFIGYS